MIIAQPLNGNLGFINFKQYEAEARLLWSIVSAGMGVQEAVNKYGRPLCDVISNATLLNVVFATVDYLFGVEAAENVKLWTNRAAGVCATFVQQAPSTSTSTSMPWRASPTDIFPTAGTKASVTAPTRVGTIIAAQGLPAINTAAIVSKLPTGRIKLPAFALKTHDPRVGAWRYAVPAGTPGFESGLGSAGNWFQQVKSWVTGQTPTEPEGGLTVGPEEFDRTTAPTKPWYKNWKVWAAVGGVAAVGTGTYVVLRRRRA